jgi:hypothetical protein
MEIAPVGHSAAQMPQPLQYSRSTVGGIVRVITASGQYIQQMKQAWRLLLAGVHFSRSNTGFFTRQSPVLPASPTEGVDEAVMWPHGPELFFFMDPRLFKSGHGSRDVSLARGC